MNPRRRGWLRALAAATLPLARVAETTAATAATAATAPAGAAAEGDAPTVRRGRVLEFPRDHGAHLAARTEWWYATGWLAPPGTDAATATPSHGFQVTFFRSRTGLATDVAGRFAARQLLFAHAAVTTLADGRHRHDQRIVRWNGDPGAATGAAATTDADVHIGAWRLKREADAWRTAVDGDGFDLALDLVPMQPSLLQGDAGFSRKGPDEAQASHYVTEPQLATTGRVATGGATLAGRAWIDHEWSDEILHRDAVGWDWCGINLFDGSALTAFVLRRADGRAVWAGGSFRRPGGAAQAFAADAVRWVAERRWRSAATGADYPVQWRVETPAGRHTLRALLDAQELDSRASTGTVYWEGLSELLDAAGRRVGLGYLEMTGYAGVLRLN